MAWYSVRLRVTCATPPTAERVASLRGGRWSIAATRRGSQVSVSLTIDAGDPAGAISRSMNVVLDSLPGEVAHAEVTRLDSSPPPLPSRRRRKTVRR